MKSYVCDVCGSRTLTSENLQGKNCTWCKILKPSSKTKGIMKEVKIEEAIFGEDLLEL